MSDRVARSAAVILASLLLLAFAELLEILAGLDATSTVAVVALMLAVDNAMDVVEMGRKR